MGNKMNEFRPDYVSPPGDTLQEVLESLGMTQAELALRMGRPKKTVNEIIQGKTAITPETALQLELALDIPASFWNNREQQYREALARIEEEEQLESQVGWLEESQIPIRDMCQRGWIEYKDDKASQLREVLRYFGVASVHQWHVVWAQPDFSFRQSVARPINLGAVAAWLRKGELEAQAIDCQPYDAKKFRQTLEEIRDLTPQPAETILPEVISKCASTGVAIVLIPSFPNTGVSGATRWLTPQKALLQLSLRYKSEDHLWFSFFHEGGHILRHGKTKVFLEPENKLSDSTEEEEEADKFARDLLIPLAKLREFVAKVGNRYPRRAEVLAFSTDLGIAPGSVVGRLQHDGYLPHSHLNGLRRRLRWREDGQVITLDKEL